MQKLVHLGLTCAITMGLVACGGSGGGGNKSSSSTAVVSSSIAAISSSAQSSAQSSSSVASSIAASSLASSTASSQENSSETSSVASSQMSSVQSSAASSASVVSLTGVFLDSAVAGIGYRTETKNGFTNDRGEYDYVEGETVTFFIGDLELPPVAAKGVLTPLDLAGTDQLTNQVVMNISILLQSLDSDGDPSNGITIDYDALEDTAEVIDFNQAVATFSTAITNLAMAAGNTVVTEEDAREHLQNTLENIDTINASRLLGTWYLEQQDGDDSYKIVLAFIDETHYMSLDFAFDSAGLEIGTYTWDIDTGLLTVNATAATGTDSGLNFSDGDYYIHVSGEQLLMMNGDEPPASMVKLSSDTGNSFVGGWYIQEPGTDILVGFTEDHYFMGQYSTEENDNGVSGVESGTYTYNPETKEVRFDTDVDTNLQWGFSHPCAVLNLEVANDLHCGPDGSEILQTMTKTNNQLVFVSQADTMVNEGTPQPVTFYEVGTVTNTESPLTGAWVIGDDYFIFEANNTVTQIKVATDDVNCKRGIAHGTYSWNESTSAFNANFALDETAVDPEDSCSLEGITELSLNGDQAELIEGEETFTLTRIKASEAAPLAGSWKVGDGNYFVFTPTNSFAHAKVSNDDPNCQIGMATGTFTWSANMFNPTVLMDSTDNSEETNCSLDRERHLNTLDELSGFPSVLEANNLNEDDDSFRMIKIGQ